MLKDMIWLERLQWYVQATWQQERNRNVLDSLERFIIRDGISERGQAQMVKGYNYQTARPAELGYRD